MKPLQTSWIKGVFYLTLSVFDIELINTSKKGYDTKVGILRDTNAVSFRLCSLKKQERNLVISKLISLTHGSLQTAAKADDRLL